jgi:hypothetical protein
MYNFDSHSPVILFFKTVISQFKAQEDSKRKTEEMETDHIHGLSSFSIFSSLGASSSATALWP